MTTTTPWHEPPRIRHQITRQLARFYNVLYIELPYTSTSRNDEFERIDENLTIFRPRGFRRLRRLLWHNLAAFHFGLNLVLTRKIVRAVHGCGYSTAVLINFQFNFPELMLARVFERRIYVCNDDFQAEARRPWAKSLHWRAEREVVGAADTCLAVSAPLVRRLSAWGARVELFLPGHELPVPTDADESFRLGRTDTTIRVCYMGYINTRLRMDWLVALASQSGIQLTLIGPIDPPDLASDLLARPNVVRIAHLIGHRLERQLANSDVLVMPYDVRQEAVRAITAPNKLFQYLASGRPVVCSNLPDLLRLPEKFLYIASDATEFVRAVKQAYEDDGVSLARSRLEFSRANTWDARGNRLHSLLSGPAPEVESDTAETARTRRNRSTERRSA